MAAADSTSRTGSSAPGVLIYNGGRVEGKHSFDTARVHVAPHVTELGNEAFRNCPNLVEVQLNEGLRLIGEGAFVNCNELRRVTIPSTVTKLSTGAFNSCFKLAEVELNEGLRTIGMSAFKGCSALRSVNIPSTVTELNRDTFDSCSSLVNVLLNEGLQFIGGGGFRDCAVLQRISIPSTVAELGICAFSGCRNLEKVRINEGLQFIASGAFRRCNALKSITIPSAVTNLGDGVFEGCENLVEVKLNEGLKTIGECSFEDCKALRSVTIPSTVTKIGRDAFTGCANFTELILMGGERLLDKEFFSRSVLNEDLGLLNIEILDVLSVFEDESAIRGCPLTTVKISVSWALSERMARLSSKHRLTLDERICDLRDVELMKDGEILACFPLELEDDVDDEIDELDFAVVDATRSLYKILQLIAFHELKESSILIELAMWKSRIDGTACLPREDCRASIPDTAKSSIMDYCGFTGFLRPSIEGA